jgi:hypothetical protein
MSKRMKMTIKANDIMLMKPQNAQNKIKIKMAGLDIANVTLKNGNKILRTNLYARIVQTHPTLADKIKTMFLKSLEILD